MCSIINGSVGDDYRIVVEKPLDLEPLMVNMKVYVPEGIRLLIAELGGLSLKHSLTREQMYAANQVEMRRLILTKYCRDSVLLLFFVVIIVVMQIMRLHVVVVALGLLCAVPAALMTNRTFVCPLLHEPLFFSCRDTHV